MNLFTKYKFHLDKILLSSILLLIIIQNFIPNTYLIGWDNLMPELNIWLNLKRSLFAVWQEYQGLGLVGGMGHATDLIRQIILLPLIALLPQDLIRYLWHFLMLILGTFSIYLGLQSQFKFKKTTSFISALFYLLNFGTIQYFWAPYEAFSTFWGFFPLLIFSLWEYLKNISTERSRPFPIKKFLIINLLAIPAFYIETLFVVYFLCIGLILLSHFIFSLKQNKPQTIKRYTSLVLLILLLNSFWFFPFLYFLKNDVSNPQLSIGNLMSSEASFLRNQKRGTISDFAILRGYYYDFPDSNNNSFMLPWQQHFSNPLILTAGYVLSLFVLIGIFSLIRQRSQNSFKTVSVLAIFTLGAIALLSATPPFSDINHFLRQSSLIDQIFRAPFTKFIVPTIFSFTILFAFGFNFISSLLKRKFFNYTFLVFSLSLVFIFSLPVFQGHLFYPKMRTNIPGEYLEMFEYFKNINPTARIANLPSGNYWGWTDYRWGPNGSGFIWYGIEQPILDRAFDGWNIKNEQYYWELNFALQQKDPNLLQNILNKYSIQYVVFDNNSYFPNSKVFSKLSLNTKDLLNQASFLKPVKQFNQISIYEFNQTTNPYILSNPKNILEPTFFYQDTAFQKFGNYISTSNPQNTFPFANLFTNRLQNELSFQIKTDQNNIYLSTNNNSYSNNFPLIIASPNPINEDHYRLTNNTGVQVKGFDFPTLTLDKSYLVKITSRNILGYPLEISAVSNNNEHLFFSTKLESQLNWTDAWFIIPKSENYPFNSGISITFGNLALNDKTTTNDIKSIEIYQIPFDNIVSVQIPNLDNTPPTSKINLPFSSSIFFYKIKNTSINPPSNSYLVLPQSFHQGWLAFTINNNRINFLKDHVLVNNWANGWTLPPARPAGGSDIYLVFWPQILEFLGLALLIPLLLYIIKK